MAFDLQPSEVPAGLDHDDFILRPLLATDDVLDHAAVMDTREQLRLWEQSTWPADDFTVASNREDLESHESMHVAGRAFTYTVMNPAETE